MSDLYMMDSRVHNTLSGINLTRRGQRKFYKISVQGDQWQMFSDMSFVFSVQVIARMFQYLAFRIAGLVSM